MGQLSNLSMNCFGVYSSEEAFTKFEIWQQTLSSLTCGNFFQENHQICKKYPSGSTPSSTIKYQFQIDSLGRRASLVCLKILFSMVKSPIVILLRTESTKFLPCL